MVTQHKILQHSVLGFQQLHESQSLQPGASETEDLKLGLLLKSGKDHFNAANELTTESTEHLTEIRLVGSPKARQAAQRVNSALFDFILMTQQVTAGDVASTEAKTRSAFQEHQTAVSSFAEIAAAESQ